MTEEQIVAYVDGELGPIEALRFERAMAADPAIAVEVDRHRRLRDAIVGHFGPVAEEPVPTRLSALLEARDNVIALPVRQFFGRGSGARYAALAATLVAGMIVGHVMPRPTAPLDGRDGVIVAQGDLAKALDTQLASAGEQGGAYRIGTSFRSSDDRYCRTFTSAAGAGLGCHGPSGWKLERFVAGGISRETGAYRQAGSASAEIFTAAQAMIAGAPLDADQERRARARGWATGAQ